MGVGGTASGSIRPAKPWLTRPKDVQFLDAYAKAQGIPTRSAVMQKAVRLLRSSALGPEYEDAWREWSESGDASAWETALDDGLA